MKEPENTIYLSTAIHLAEFAIDRRFEEYKISNGEPNMSREQQLRGSSKLYKPG
jgi:hypothetical protein